MYTVTKEIDFCYGHRLLNHMGKCRFLHGHNARATITLAVSQLNSMGMVCDFSEIGHVVGNWIDAEIDHIMLLHKDDPLLPAIQKAGERVYVMNDNPTAENIARLIFDFTERAGYPVVDVSLYETESSRASYRRD